MPIKKLIVFAVGFIAATLLAISLTVGQSRLAARTYGNLEQVSFIGCYDGDTCTFVIAGVHPLIGERISVRLRGIDAPEVRGRCVRERLLARAARDALNRILGRAGRIELNEVARGKYFRILADVLADGESVSAILIDKGLAVRYEGGERNASWCK